MTMDTSVAERDPQVKAIKYEVNAYPDRGDDDPNRIHFRIFVEYRGHGMWAVCDGFRRCLDSAGDWSCESQSSERGDDWLTAHRFDLESAIELAKREAPRRRLNGRTIDEILAFVDSVRAREGHRG